MRRLRGVVGRDGGFSDVCGRPVAGVVGPVWAGWWWWLWLDCLVVVVSAGGPDDGPCVWCVVCGGGWACLVVVMVCHCGLGVVPLGVWFAITEHSPLRVARARWSGSPSGRQCVPAGCSRVPPDGGCAVAGRGWVHCRAHTRPSGRRLFRSRPGLGSLPGAHTSVRTAAVS